MSEVQEMQRSRRSKGSGATLLDPYRFGIAVCLLLCVGFFLLAEDLALKATLYRGLVVALSWVAVAASSAPSRLWQVLEINEKSDIVGALLVVVASGLVAHRLRDRWMGRHPIVDTCPTCGSHLYRRRRTWPQRAMATLLRLELRAYGCKGCGWSAAVARHSRRTGSA